MSTLTNIVAVLKNAGVTGPTLINAIQSIAASSPTAAIQAACTTILANSNNPAVVKDEATKIAEIPNLPTAVANVLPVLQAATTADQIIEAVRDLETALGPSTGGLGLNLGNALGAS
jgi:hypothetical protein